MNTRIKALWIAALRSDNYVQGTSVLTYTDDYDQERNCCLGVLCQIAIADGLPLDVITSKYPNESVQYGESRARGVLPIEVMLWAELPTDDPYIHDRYNEPIKCSDANDNEGMTFEQIADAIEYSL